MGLRVIQRKVLMKGCDIMTILHGRIFDAVWSKVVAWKWSNENKENSVVISVSGVELWSRAGQPKEVVLLWYRWCGIVDQSVMWICVINMSCPLGGRRGVEKGCSFGVIICSCSEISRCWRRLNIREIKLSNQSTQGRTTGESVAHRTGLEKGAWICFYHLLMVVMVA